MAKTNLGKVANTPKGAWSSSTAYVALDIVSDSGNSYMAKKAVPAGTALSNTEYWLCLAEKGGTGSQGKGISSITKTSTSGLVDTYTITYTDSTTSTFTVTNGADGDDGRGISSISKTSASGSVDTYTITYTDSTTSTFTVTNGSVTSVNGQTGAVTGLAETDGYYDTLSVGLADNLIDRKGTGDSRSFTFDTACGDASIGDDGNAIVQSVHGNTIVWNQVLPLNTGMNYTAYGITVAYDSTKNAYKVTVTETPSTNLNSWAINFSTTHWYNFISGYKYLILTESTSDYVGINIGDGSSLVTNRIVADISGYYTYRAVIKANCPIGEYYFRTSVIDLTAMFGSGNEPTTVSAFKELFPLDYYAYNAGELVSYNGTGIKTVGFNQWDEEWEVGCLTTAGIEVANVNCIRSKNYVPVFPSTNYCFYCGTNVYRRRILFYDNSLNVISNTNLAHDSNYATFATPSNCYYIKFCTLADTTPYYGGTYLNDICINLSWSGYRNGEYEAYETHTLSLPVSTYFPNGMRSAGSVYDELTKSKAVTRIGAVDLGTLDWSFNSSKNSFHSTGIASYVKSVGVSTKANIICKKYQTYSASNQWDSSLDKSVSIGYIITANAINIIDTSYTDAAAFKTAMSGVYLFYELATPTEQTISPELYLTYPVQDFGVEISLPENDDEPATSPFKGIIKYSEDFTRDIVNLPKNYDTTDGLDSLCSALASALGTALGGTFTITRGSYDETNKKYAFTCSYTAST